MATSLEKALQKAIEAPDIVVGLRAFGLTQNDIATVTKVSPRAIRGWKTANPRSEPYDRLAELQSLVVLLSDSLTPRGVGQWLHARNRLLGGERPIDLLGRGEIERVEKAARAFIEGAYV